MTEMIWYLLIGLSVSALCYAFWLPQQRQDQKSWLLKQLQSPGEDKQVLLEALSRVNQAPQAKHKGLLLAILLITPVALLFQALWFDNQHAPEITQSATNTQGQTPDLASAIKQLEQKLAENPDDIQGQLLYAQSMVAMKRYDVAAKAYEKANQLQPNDAAILTEWAEAVAFRNNTGSFLGQPSDLLAQAIELNPKHQKAMWLYGIVLYEQQQFAAAETLWTDLLAMVDSPGIRNTLLKQVNQAREAQGKNALVSSETKAAAEPALYNIEVFGKQIPDEATLFVFAKSTDGMPMPIAAKKTNGPFQWPVTISLSDSDSLQGNRLLSQFETVELSAIISMSGAIEDKQWQSDSQQSAPNNKITLNLKRQQQ
ncbi:tetratricopeptide repeat protein [Marinicella rhabdoformis]|uniref:tetratricopeptide repeat protein n=1 Tax=Marinicella rhabdoformis TaxID=2580566 RepID=UPI0012AED473|nr:hypothetical protein [Marinicella rhabdoformis]